MMTRALISMVLLPNNKDDPNAAGVCNGWPATRSKTKNHTATASAPSRPATKPRLKRVLGRCIIVRIPVLWPAVLRAKELITAKSRRQMLVGGTSLEPQQLLLDATRRCCGTAERLRRLKMLTERRQSAGNQGPQLIVLDLLLGLFQHADGFLVPFHHRIGN